MLEAESDAERCEEELAFAVMGRIVASGREDDTVRVVGECGEKPRPRPRAKIWDELFWGIWMSIPEIEMSDS